MDIKSPVFASEFYGFESETFSFLVSLVPAAGGLVQVTRLSSNGLQGTSQVVTLKREFLENAPGVLFRFRRMKEATREEFKRLYLLVLGYPDNAPGKQVKLPLVARSVAHVV